MPIFKLLITEFNTNTNASLWKWKKYISSLVSRRYKKTKTMVYRPDDSWHSRPLFSRPLHTSFQHMLLHGTTLRPWRSFKHSFIVLKDFYPVLINLRRHIHTFSEKSPNLALTSNTIIITYTTMF